MATYTIIRPVEVWREIALALGLSVGSAVALGFSRFAYGLLLPPMRADLGWTYVEAGALNTANGAGYVVGALAAAWFASRLGTSRSFSIGLLVSILILLLTAGTSSLASLFVLRTCGGVSTAITFILGAALAAAICPTGNTRRRGTLVGIYVAGSSFGIILAGFAIPTLLKNGAQHWPLGWIALGGLGLIGLIPAWRAARRVPEPVGGSMSVLKAAEFRLMVPTFLGYGFFGAGYVGYMTFIMALLQRQGSSNDEMVRFWIALGLISAVSTLLWGRTLGQFRGGRGPALVFATAMLGTLPVLIYPSSVSMFISAVLFGGSFMAGPTSITILTQRQLPVQSWTAAISLLTAGFAFGQALGPILAGAISDITGDIAAGLWVSPVLLGIGACANLLQHPAASEQELALSSTG